MVQCAGVGLCLILVLEEQMNLLKNLQGGLFIELRKNKKTVEASLRAEGITLSTGSEETHYHCSS